ncbi:DNA-directed RNA polymerase [Gorgonomyces haynaldii]|nr:DNA-directed RNA polymerase [Gorgonomyces haynaldii]
MDLVITFEQDNRMEFDLIGVDVSIANAIRRVLIAEVPTMAIEHVFVLESQMVMSEQVFASRLGLVPLKVDPRQFEYLGEGETPTDLNTIVFKMDVQCTKNPKAQEDEVDNKKKFINHCVYSQHIEWQPQGDQSERFESIRPVHDDILLNKFFPGDKVVCEMHAIKGIGQDHAKFSPVEVASYRLLPKITLTKPIVGDAAVKLQKCFAEGVIAIEKKHGEKRAVVSNPRKDTGSRECFRHEEFLDAVKLERVHDHFLFELESVGHLPPKQVLEMALDVCLEKVEALKQCMQNLQ